MSDAEALMREHLDDRDWIYVFPSEVAADWTLKSLLGGEAGTAALPRGKCISWDRFKEETFAAPPGKRPVNGIERALFLEDLLAENARRPLFRSLIPPEHAASSAAHLAGLKTILPLLGKTEKLLRRAGEGVAAAKRADLALLAARYAKFLREAGLYEPDDERPVFNPGGKTYVVFYPEVIADWENVAPALRGSAAARLCGSAAQPTAPSGGALLVYPGLEDEIDALMNAVLELLDADVAADRIAVTAAGLDELALPLVDGARRHGLPLVLNAGRPLTEYPGVNVLGQAAAAVDSGFGLRALEALLGNRSLPWTEPGAAEALLRFGLEHNCLRNFAADGRPFDLWDHHFKRLGAAGGLKDPGLAAARLYRSLRTSLLSLAGADSFAGVKKAFTKFRAVFFAPEGFGERERRCLELALDKLDELAETARALPLPPPASPFRVWLALLADTRYVPPAREAGIAVYPYRVSAGIRPDRHFVVNASEETTRVVVPPFPFLAVDERARLGVADLDLSDAFLSLYQASGLAVTMSASRTSFGAVRLPPPYFVKSGSLREIGPDPAGPADAFAREERFFLGREAALPDRLFALQAAGLSAAAARPIPKAGSLFTAAPVAPAALRGRIAAALAGEDGRLVVSPTDLERFESCAFRFLLEKTTGLAVRESEFAQDKALWYGSFIHRVFERFFRGLKEGKGRFERAAAGRLEVEILEAAETEAASWEESRPLPLPPLWRTVRREMREGFQAFIGRTAEAFGGFDIVEVEGGLNAPLEKEDVTLTGKIDLLGRGEKGLIIVDYKKNSVPRRGDILPAEGDPVSFQIPCYALLARTAGGPVAAASYYSFAKREYRHVLHPGENAYFTPAEMEEAIMRTRAKIAAMAKRIRAGDFSIARRSEGACSDCPLRPVCRRKYFLQFEG